jgi:hypothetical protein
MTIAPSLLKSKNILVNASYDHFFSIRERNAKDIKKIALRNNICKIKITLDKDKKNIDSIKVKALNGIIQLFKEQKSYIYDSLKLNIKKTNAIIDNQFTDLLEINTHILNIEPDTKWKNILEHNFQYFKSNIYLNNPSSFSELPNFEKYTTRGYDKPEIIINNMELMHNLSKFNIQGILIFDKNMTLNGDIILKIGDYQKLLSFLAKKNIINSDTETNIRFMLSFMSSTIMLQKNDGTVDVPLKVHKNIVYSGKIPIIELSL